ncbi:MULTISPECIES: Nramp family divalent metal transporter [Streptomyces]|uniref:Nramp family divalent metal transporter n=1 Tax=Streptomyces TaxID=1883 RepID=UPI0019269421|nr:MULTISPECIES: Nramp family divalent metal transporter [Streptomyces]
MSQARRAGRTAGGGLAATAAGTRATAGGPGTLAGSGDVVADTAGGPAASGVDSATGTTVASGVGSPEVSGVGTPVASGVGGRPLLRMLGPAFVAAIAYVDPGNFATNVSGGATEGYSLVWIVVAASGAAALIQFLAGRLGLATGRDLCTLVREQGRPWQVAMMWVQAELVCMATDLAEIVGGAVALNLLFGLQPALGGLLVVGLSYAVTALADRRQVRFERLMALALGGVLVAFVAACVLAKVRVGAVATGLVPSASDIDKTYLTLAIAIVGATVMPHAIYVHSALTARLHGTARGVAAHGQRTDVGLAMTLAALGNLVLLGVAAALLHGRSGFSGDVTLADAHHAFTGASPLLGLVFLVALLLSGLAASGVGTYAGQVVMRGLLRRSVPTVLRRGLTALPGLVVLCVGMEPTKALVASQVVLSFGIPFALVPLIRFVRRVDLMGDWAVGRVTVLAASGCAAVIVALNCLLLVQIL